MRGRLTVGRDALIVLVLVRFQPPQLEERKSSGRMRSLSRKQVAVHEAVGRSSRPASATRRDGREVKTPGSQPGSRGSIPRRGARASNRCQVVERQDVRLLPGRRGFEPLPGSSAATGLRSVAEKFRRVAADHETWVRIPPGRPSRSARPRGRRPTARMPVRHTGDEGSSPSDHTPGTDQQTTTQERGRPCPRTSTTS